MALTTGSGSRCGVEVVRGSDVDATPVISSSWIRASGMVEHTVKNVAGSSTPVSFLKAAVTATLIMESIPISASWLKSCISSSSSPVSRAINAIRSSAKLDAQLDALDVWGVSISGCGVEVPLVSDPSSESVADASASSCSLASATLGYVVKTDAGSFVPVVALK